MVVDDAEVAAVEAGVVTAVVLFASEMEAPEAFRFAFGSESLVDPPQAASVTVAVVTAAASRVRRCRVVFTVVPLVVSGAGRTLGPVTAIYALGGCSGATAAALLHDCNLRG